MPEPINDQNVFVLRNEVERLHAELKAKSHESVSLYQRLQILEEKQEEQEKFKKIAEKSYVNKISQLKSQLIGAVRRINYLVEEKKKNVIDEKKRVGYMAKLELEYAKTKENVKSLSKRRGSVAAEDSQAAGTTVAAKYATLKEKNLESIKNVDKEILKAKEELQKMDPEKLDIEEQLKQYYEEMANNGEEATANAIL